MPGKTYLRYVSHGGEMMMMMMMMMIIRRGVDPGGWGALTPENI